jgi:hypothetical protein
MRKTYDIAGGVEDEGSGLPCLSGMASRLFPCSVVTTMDSADILGSTDLRHMKSSGD